MKSLGLALLTAAPFVSLLRGVLPAPAEKDAETKQPPPKPQQRTPKTPPPQNEGASAPSSV